MFRRYLILIFAATIYAQSWDFPEAWEDGRHAIIRQIRAASAPLRIYTTSLDDRKIAEALRKRLREARPVILYTSDLPTASRWAAYRHIDVFLVRPDAVPSATVIQNDLVSCALDLPLVTEMFRRTQGKLICEPFAGPSLQERFSDAEPYFTDRAI